MAPLIYSLDLAGTFVFALSGGLAAARIRLDPFGFAVVAIVTGLVKRLREMGVGATHVNRVLDGSRTTDAAICTFVDQGGMLLITKDGDVRDSHYLRGSPARVLRVTLGNLPNAELVMLLERYWEAIVESAAQERCYLELSREGLIRLPTAS